MLRQLLPLAAIFLFSLFCVAAMSLAADPPAATPAPASPPKVATLHFGPVAGRDGPGIVGKDIRVEDWREVMKKLEADKPDIVIVRINSSDLTDADPDEAVRFQDLFRELKKRTRVVGWIDSATVSGALAVLPIEEYHMFPHGIFGAISMGERDLKEPPDLAKWKMLAETAAADGKHPIMVIRAMQDMVPLSVSLNATTGAATFTQDAAGPIVVNKPGQVLTLTAADAVKYGFAHSVAATEEQLLANLGITKVQRVGEDAAKWLDEKMAERGKGKDEEDATAPAPSTTKYRRVTARGASGPPPRGRG